MTFLVLGFAGVALACANPTAACHDYADAYNRCWAETLAGEEDPIGIDPEWCDEQDQDLAGEAATEAVEEYRCAEAVYAGEEDCYNNLDAAEDQAADCFGE